MMLINLPPPPSMRRTAAKTPEKSSCSELHAQTSAMTAPSRSKMNVAIIRRGRGRVNGESYKTVRQREEMDGKQN